MPVGDDAVHKMLSFCLQCILQARAIPARNVATIAGS